MPRYTVLTTAAHESRWVVIEDERHHEDLAVALVTQGYLATTDVTAIAGRADHPVVLFLANVISIKTPPNSRS